MRLIGDPRWMALCGCRTLLVPVLVCFGAGPGLAWGPHAEITQAALDALGPEHPVRAYLGDQGRQLTNYCWLPDFKRLPFKTDTQNVYANDYLLFPAVPTHLDHICPEVEQTYRPYFARAVQALRTESRANAARWIGSLLHFVEDTGSPPHAARIRGPLHIKMENWIDPDQIRIPGYQPQLLGHSLETAAEGLVGRMQRLIAFAKPKGTQLLTPVMIGRRQSVKPIVLECALETTRATADLLHTLGQFLPRTTPGLAGLRGQIHSQAASGFELVPVRIVVHGTSISTLTDEEGRFALRNLEPATRRITLCRPGNGETNVTVTLKPDHTSSLELSLPPSPANLIRNGRLDLSWIDPVRPDCWHPTEGGWEGEVIPLADGRRYELTVEFNGSGTGKVEARWSRRLEYGLPYTLPRPSVEKRILTASDNRFVITGAPAKGLFQVKLIGSGPPSEFYRSVTLIERP